MSDIAVRNNKISTVKRADRLFSLGLIGGAVILIVIFFLVVIPAFVTKSVYFYYGANKYKTTTNAPISAVIKKVDSARAVNGNLLSVAGTVLTPGGGDKPTYTINGKMVATNTVVKSGDKIGVAPGRDVIEKTVEVTKEHHVGYKRNGSGPLVFVTTPGSNPLVTSTKGAVSGVVEKKQTVRAGVEPVTAYKMYNNPQDKVVALTFDDGPSAQYTQKVVAVLSKYHVRGTFFELGTEINKRPQITRAVAQAGNQVALHSQHHSRLAGVPVNHITSNVVEGKASIKKAVGVEPTYMRPPYGSVDGSVYDAIYENKMNTALWTIDTKDWSRPGVTFIVQQAKKHMTPGAILLMHDGGGNRDQTVKALPYIIKLYKRAGYRFVTIDEYGALLAAN